MSCVSYTIRNHRCLPATFAATAVPATSYQFRSICSLLAPNRCGPYMAIISQSISSLRRGATLDFYWPINRERQPWHARHAESGAQIGYLESTPFVPLASIHSLLLCTSYLLPHKRYRSTDIRTYASIAHRIHLPSLRYPITRATATQSH